MRRHMIKKKTSMNPYAYITVPKGYYLRIKVGSLALEAVVCLLPDTFSVGRKRRQRYTI